MPSQLKFWRKGEAHRTTITRHNHETHSLLGADPSELHLVKSAHDDVRPSSSCPSMACNIIAVLLCITCVALNWLISITYSTCRSSPDFRSVSREQYHALRRPSPFLGFDSIPRASPPIPRMLINYPMAIALVNSSRPEQVFSDDPQQHMTETGTVSPEVRPVVLTNEIGVIVQFRAMDYQMERCELHIKMAGADTATLPGSKTIGVYRLASDKPLDTKSLSYSNRPARIATIGRFSVAPASPVDWHHEFRCIWDSISTFEVAFLGQGMQEFDDGQDFTIQWWQDKDQSHPPQAIYLIQRESS
ncbi:hypothetical protein D9619_010308 [Psilocybe cf. subviscida]|uniref:Ubiquitin 3 binding protein But2 C-terminal domain-containing protein n=1 Tax=Psilocybe cf. subviscida TaxID=2480587 RepID=A0A8H5AS17_9AGAR|nr:hypothetical protein D9619_010308 [Psilocybe cf. subviscida]